MQCPSASHFREVRQGPWEKVDRTDYKVKIDHEEKAIYITGQSSRKEDWPDNFNFRVRKLKELNQEAKQWFPDRDDIWVHSGFLAQYEAVRQKLLDLVKQYKDYAIFIDGYSLGGSWTQILFEDIWHRYRDRIIKGLFYAPGNVWRKLPKEYRKAFKKHVTYVYCWWDPVTWMRVFRFFRYGKNIRIGKPWRMWPFQHNIPQIERALKEKYGG